MLLENKIIHTFLIKMDFLFFFLILLDGGTENKNPMGILYRPNTRECKVQYLQRHGRKWRLQQERKKKKTHHKHVASPKRSPLMSLTCYFIDWESKQVFLHVKVMLVRAFLT